MTEKEVQEITKILEDAGWEPQLCDTPIPVYESVHAGNPEDPGQPMAGASEQGREREISGNQVGRES